MRQPFPEWVEYRPNQIWIYDTTHFPRAKSCVTVVEDLVSRKWIADIVSSEETSTQVEIVFTDALAAQGLLELVEARDDGLVDPTVDDEARPILLAVSDNGPQMTSGSTREFMALCAIAQHFGRPGTPTDQAWIESSQRSPQSRVPTPAWPSPTRRSCAPSSSSSASDGTGCDCTPGSATSRPTTSTKDEVPPSAKPERPGSKRRLATARLPSK